MTPQEAQEKLSDEAYKRVKESALFIVDVATLDGANRGMSKLEVSAALSIAAGMLVGLLASLIESVGGDPKKLVENAADLHEYGFQIGDLSKELGGRDAHNARKAAPAD